MTKRKKGFRCALFGLIMSLCGCAPQLTTQNDIHEAVDTTAPKGTFECFFIASNKEIQLDAFGLKVEDCSDFTVGFRNYELIKTEEELADIFQKALNESEEIQMAELLELHWNAETDAWEEKGVSADSLKEEIQAEEDGLYRVEIAAADVHGNAAVMNGYVLIDTTAPVISGAEDAKVTVTNKTDAEKMTAEGVTAKDNIFGDLTSQMIIKEEILEGPDEEITGFKGKIIYTATDFFDNETVVERIMEFEFDKKSIAQEKKQDVVAEQAAAADGFNRAKAEETFVLVNKERAEAGLHELTWDETLYDLSCMRAKEIVIKAGHERPDGTYITSLIREMGYHGGSGENLARYSLSPAEVVEAWMYSPAHKDNVLTDFYNYGSVAWYTYQGVNYVVNLFRG